MKVLKLHWLKTSKVKYVMSVDSERIDIFEKYCETKVKLS